MARTKSLLLLTYMVNFLCVAGLLLSVYSFIVETSVEMDMDYVPACDVSALFSCSKAFNSPYGRGFGLVGKLLGDDHWLNEKNCVYGLFVYAFLFLLSMSSWRPIMLVMHVILLAMNLLTVYLVTVLIHLQTICLVCVSLYIINFALLCASKMRLRRAKEMMLKKRA